MKKKPHFPRSQSFGAKEIFLLTLTFVCAFLSCKKDGGTGSPSYSVKQIDSISNMYVFNLDGTVETAEEFTSDTVINFYSLFFYRSGRIVKRGGGYLDISYRGPVYIPTMYDTVIYNGNAVKIRTLNSDPSYTTPLNERDLVFSNGVLAKQTSATDTTTYYYTNKLLAKTIDYSKYTETITDFSYDQNKNLTEIYRTWHNTYDTTEGGFSRWDLSGFDNTPNPLKGFGLWDDLLVRSLSTNNFTDFQYVKDSASYSKGTIYLHYDAAGNVDYSIP